MASGRPDSRMSVEPSSFDAASTSKKKKIQKTQTTLRLEPGTAKENLLPKTIELGRNPLHTEPVLQLTRKVKSIWKRHGDHYLRISLDTLHYMEAVFLHGQEDLWNTTRRPYGIFECEYLAIWGMFMNTLFKQQFISEEITRRTVNGTLSGTIFWWNTKTDLWTVRNPWSKNTVDLLFENYWVRRHHMEIGNLIVRKSLSDHYCQNLRLPPTLCSAWERWEVTQTQLGWIKIKWCSQNNCLKELNRIDGMQTEFERKIFPGFTTIGILEEIHRNSWNVHSMNLSTPTVESSSCPCSMKLCGEKNDNTEECNRNSVEVGKYALRFHRGHWSFLGPGLEKTWCKTCADKTKQRVGQNCSNDDTPNGYRIWSPSFFEHPVSSKEES